MLDPTERYVTDDRGVRHSHCHGVPAKQWFSAVREATTKLSDPGFRESWGLIRLSPDTEWKCDDMDCKRLNRRDHASRGLYYLSHDLLPVRPPNDSFASRAHCEGHPWKARTCMCRTCAIVTTAKRLIDAVVEEKVKRAGPRSR